MPHVVVLLDKNCSDLAGAIHRELTLRYGSEFAIAGEEEGPQLQNIPPAEACRAWIDTARPKLHADVYVAITRRYVPPAQGDCVLVLASISPQKTLLFVLLPEGHGVMQWLEEPKEQHRIPDKDPLAFVFKAIEANDKERFS